ncbi:MULTISPECIES: twin-arginine translocase subunit TatC [unclassified Haladaptatus]|uniref:twin-arginine translocase subunit TatC n=1 Tax=unclassified Haladaptatus TaxID=2622732 RepID=UPI0023E8EF85|nr:MULTISPECIES: twin-arginine translocase subunit TatC [unclassified Haladaptatus]
MSGAIDDDTKRAVASGRETVGAMLSTAQTHLQKVFIVFVIGLMGTIYALREFVWVQLKADLFSKMGPDVADQTDVIAVTPFDVILLQVKIGLVVGILLAIPFLLYYSRDALRERGLWPTQRIGLWKFTFILTLSLGLFVGGVVYAYALFFPLMFEFLAGNAIQGGFQPTYSIVHWAQFVFLLTLSFGLAAQLPLAMTGLAYIEIVPYETWRDKWRHAVVAIFIFGALFSPPDPFTQIMWAVPLLFLYGFSLGLTKVLVSTRRQRDAPSPASAGDPAEIDIDSLDAAAIYAAPTEVFAAMSEDEALQHASTAMQDDDADKAQAILDRFDEVQEAVEADPVENGATAAAVNDMPEDEDAEAPAANTDAADGDVDDVRPDDTDEESGSAITRTTTGIVNAFSEDEKTEDDIGGYYYDIAFILESLTSKAFWIVGTFMLVLASVFIFLYSGGIKIIRDNFLSKVPEAIAADGIDFGIVALHPVEALIFEVKIATVLAAVSVIPVLLYFAWPSLKERGFARGNRNVLLLWGLSMLVGIGAGTMVGYSYVAPTIVSWLAADAIQANMIISYRINAFGWLVFLTTAGIGILGMIPVSMLLFHRGRIITYRTFRTRWREVTIGILAIAAFGAPGGMFMMFILAIPTLLAYFLGLGLLWVVTLGGRRVPEKERAGAD